jgi:hypothetical protein
MIGYKAAAAAATILAAVGLPVISTVPAFAATPNTTPTHGLPSDQVTPFTTVNVGGGTWDYGASGIFSRHCWSYYVHPTHYNTATAIIGPYVTKKRASPGRWAYADSYGGFGQTCHSYWNVL